VFYDILGDFLNNSLSFNYNSIRQKTPLFKVFDFTGAKNDTRKRAGPGIMLQNFRYEQDGLKRDSMRSTC
jgi:hypothetical protein